MRQTASELSTHLRHGGNTAGLADPFATHPVRRSAAMVGGCLAVLVLPWVISEQIGTTVMLSVGWLAMTGLVIGIPVLAISLIEAGVAAIRRRLYPPIDLLELSPRVAHILSRHGYETIAQLEAASDASLVLLSNMDTRGLHEIRRAVALWQYQRWQTAGFPAERDRA